MRLTVNEIRRHQFNRKVRGYDTVEVEAFLEMVAQEVELAFRETTESKAKVVAMERDLLEYRQREKTLQDALKHAQEAAEQITTSARRSADLTMKEVQIDIERDRQKGMNELRAIQEETVKLKVQKENFLRRLRHMLQAEQELLEMLAADQHEDSSTTN